MISDEYAPLKRLRLAGWAVAVHNDYRQHGLKYTFWLFTREDARGRLVAVRGEGRTDGQALLEAERESKRRRLS